LLCWTAEMYLHVHLDRTYCRSSVDIVRMQKYVIYLLKFETYSGIPRVLLFWMAHQPRDSKPEYRVWKRCTRSEQRSAWNTTDKYCAGSELKSARSEHRNTVQSLHRGLQGRNSGLWSLNTGFTSVNRILRSPNRIVCRCLNWRVRSLRTENRRLQVMNRELRGPNRG
jgi:hypothetical protein